MKRRRGINDIRTLGQRRHQGQDQRSLLRASAIEAELNRLHQEERLLKQRLSGILERSTRLIEERNQLIESLDIRSNRDRPSRPGEFRLRY
ncbi:MAG: hypothetical protein AAGF23_02435 [Acidobacteriota bacterium]